MIGYQTRYEYLQVVCLPYKANDYRRNLPVSFKNLPAESAGKLTQIVRHASMSSYRQILLVGF